MLSDEVLDKVVERLTNRIEQGNEYILEEIGKKVKKIGSLTPTQAQQLVQVFKYGGDYEKITKKLAKITKMNVADIYKIFEEVAKSDYNFSKKFYDFRNKKFIPFDENKTLKNQVEAISKITSQKYVDLARSKALGFSVRDDEKNVIFKGLKSTYNDAIDKAVLSVSQGKTTFQDEMYRMLKEIGISGVKTLDFNGRTMRLDSAIRMHLKDALRQLHNEVVLENAKEYGADGVEISVHLNPAPDHEEVQGRQFENDKKDENKLTEWEKLQNGKTAKDYKGVKHTLDHDHKNGYRQISQYNCYHTIFPIVLGASDPLYTDEQLKEIIDNNNKGFELDGKHYTNYEGTQLQRKLETEIRKQKDLQILGKTSGNEELTTKSQIKINQLKRKYKELSKASGLPTFTERMRVSGYRQVKVK